jgi:hypothetical protein
MATQDSRAVDDMASRFFAFMAHEREKGLVRPTPGTEETASLLHLKSWIGEQQVGMWIVMMTTGSGGGGGGGHKGGGGCDRHGHCDDRRGSGDATMQHMIVLTSKPGRDY